MKLSLRALRERADALFAAGRVSDAAYYYVAVLERVPEDINARMSLADALTSLGMPQAAAPIYEAAADLAIDGGHPLIAIVACRALETALPAAKPRCEALLERLAAVYGRDSDRLADVGARLNALGLDDLKVETRKLKLCAPAQLVERAVAVGTARPADMAMPFKLPREPLLSRLSPRALLGAVRGCCVHRLPAGHPLINEGDAGSACYLVAAGRLEVLKVDDLGMPRQVAQVSAGSVVGEMALVSGAPRSATVRTLEPCDVIELGPEALAGIGEELDEIAPALYRMAQQRWMNNVIEQSALFSVFSAQQRRDLLRHFQAHQAPAGTVLFRKGEHAKGIFLVFRGEVDVKAEGRPTQRMRAGAMLGVTSLMRNEPAAATAVAATHTKLLFLPGSRVRMLRDAVPEFARAVGAIAQHRSGMINLSSLQG
ncbi:MAG: cyclic nucleotide-binding domain-containing protein [Myxococcales bacterium]|nr:cyclic nucleotide-binding domain-containing protein [Myxococcales bacterium]